MSFTKHNLLLSFEEEALVLRKTNLLLWETPTTRWRHGAVIPAAHPFHSAPCNWFVRNHTWALVKCLFLITTFSPRNSPWVHIISVTCDTGELKRRDHSWEEAQLVSEMMFLTPKWFSWLQPSTACFQKRLPLLPDRLVSPNDEVRGIIHNLTQGIWMIKEGWTQSQHGSGPGAFQNCGLGKTGYWWGGVGRIHEGFSSEPRRTPRLPTLSSASSPGPPYSGLSSLEIFCFQSIFLAK